jgi:tetrahydromethanopterin S-methyltransferase subunit G
MNPQQHSETPVPEIATPSEHAVEERRETSPGGPADETQATQFIATELRQARVALQRTQLIGLLILLLVGAELAYITNHFEQSLRPHAAAEIAEGMIARQVEDKGPDLANQLKEKIPQFLDQTPDYVLHQLPVYRESIEDRVETQLNQYCQRTSQQLGQHLDGYLDAHKDQIKGMLTAGNDPNAVHAMGASLKQELLSYLQDKPQGGESIVDQLNNSLVSLEEIQKKTQRLATAKDLTVSEKKARRAIAILGQSIDKQRQQILPTQPSL